MTGATTLTKFKQTSIKHEYDFLIRFVHITQIQSSWYINFGQSLDTEKFQKITEHY